MPKIPEKAKKPGVFYAFTEEGVELPVIDITHPAFALAEPGAEEANAMAKKAEADQEKHNRLPALVRKTMLWFMSGKSVLMRGLLGASGGFLSSMTTYLMKLGPDNLGQRYAGKIDRAIAASLPAFSARLRLQDTARLLADGIAPWLAAQPKRDLHFVNIAGGPCLDDLNALLLLRRDQYERIANRRIIIHVLDLESAGPLFGGRALEALLAPGAPLAGLKIEMEYIPYNWSQPEKLPGCLNGIDMGRAVVGVSSEGGLFNYGTDAEIAGNLKALHALTPPETVLVGTLTPKFRPGQAFNTMSGLQTIPRELDEFEHLAGQSGWKVADSKRYLMNCVVSMQKTEWRA